MVIISEAIPKLLIKKIDSSGVATPVGVEPSHPPKKSV